MFNNVYGGDVSMATSAPTTAIGYTQAPQYSQLAYDDELTPELQWPQSVVVFDQMRKTDSQCASVLRAVTLPVRRTPWRIDPNGARDEVVQLVADDLGLPIVGKQPKSLPRTKDRFSWSEHLRLALLMLPMGASYFEQVYRVEDDASRAHLRKLEWRPMKTIDDIDVAPDGGLVSIKQCWTQTDSSPKPIPVSRLVAYVHEREGGNWLGQSVLRSAYKNWLLKDRLLRVQAQTIERNGMGIPVYKGAETERSLDQGMALTQSLRAGAAAGTAIPFGAELRLMGVEGTLPDADPVIRYHDEQIARAVLAHFLNLGTQTGSWALGTTFADFFTLSLQTLAQQIADVATQHIIEDLVDLNFGESEPAPRMVFDEIGSRQAATAQAIKLLVDAGLITPDQVLDETLRQQYGLPPADPATATPPPADAAPSRAPEPEPVPGEGSVAAAHSRWRGRVSAHMAGRHNQQSHAGNDPLGLADTFNGDGFAGSARAGSGPEATGVNLVAERDGEDIYFTVTTATAAEAKFGDSHADNYSILGNREMKAFRSSLERASEAAKAGKPFETVIHGEDNGDVVVSAEGSNVAVSARNYGWDDPLEEEEIRPSLKSREEFESEQDIDPDDPDPYTYEQYVADYKAGKFDYEAQEKAPYPAAVLTVEQARGLVEDMDRLTLAVKPVRAAKPRPRRPKVDSSSRAPEPEPVPGEGSVAASAGDPEAVADEAPELVVAHGTHNQKDHGRRLPKSLSGDSPFAGFTRPQLQKAARRRGIELEPREDRASIERKLAKHLAGDDEDKTADESKADRTLKPSEVSVGSRVEWTDNEGVVRRGEVISHTKSSAKVQWDGGRVELVKLNDKDLRFLANDSGPEPAAPVEVAPDASPARMTQAQYTSLLADEFVRLSMLRGTSEQDAREQAGPDPSIDDLKERNTVLRAKLRQKGVDYRTEEQKRTDDAEKNRLLDEVERLANEAGHDGPAKRAGASKMSKRELAAFVADAKEFQQRRKAKRDAEGKGSSAVAAFKAAEDKSRATPRQVGYIKGLLRERGLSGAPAGPGGGPTSTEEIQKLSNAEARAYINRLLRGDY